ncbi:MAG: zinc-binding alcohol dehydrogenase family protein [Methylobacterium mesophilicum]|nr:zinc-binding alcohol dehydrogenase family protein [Methylobacterium mesophilicum]
MLDALVCVEPGRLEIARRPVPDAPRPGWALVDVAYVGICGTDYHIYEGKHPFLAYPRVMGHEISGRVAAVGEGVSLEVGQPVIVNPYLACGHCVACRQGKPNACVQIEVLGVHRDGAMAGQVAVPESNLYPAGDLSLREAATVEFLAIGAHAVRRAQAKAGGRALVIGAGPIGLGTAIFARIAGLAVTLLDMSAERLDFARDELGFDAIDGARAIIAEAVAAQTEGDGFDFVFDATGNAQSMQGAFAHVAHGGTLVLVSVVKDAIAFSDPEFHKREMSLIGSRNATREDFDHVVRALREGLVPVAKLLTHETTLAGAIADLPQWAATRAGLVKALVKVGG